jgi:hypothetical protein
MARHVGEKDMRGLVMAIVGLAGVLAGSSVEAEEILPGIAQMLPLPTELLATTAGAAGGALALTSTSTAQALIANGTADLVVSLATGDITLGTFSAAGGLGLLQAATGFGNIQQNSVALVVSF